MNGKKRQKQVTTPDDWYPTATDGTVRVSLMHDSPGAFNWRVAVWGDDDFGMELFDLSMLGGLDTFNRITDGITQERLRNWGFMNA